MDRMTAHVRNRTLIHKGRVFELARESLTLSNGVQTEMDIINHPGAAAIIAVTADRQVLMLQQYRHAVAKTLWEIPAGTLENGEDSLACAQRELVEETGYSAGRWASMGVTTPVPGYSNERIHLFLAQDLDEAEQDLDADEIIKVEKVTFDQVISMITRGDIEDSKTIAAVFLAMQKFGSHLEMAQT